MPPTLFRFVWKVSGWHQLGLVGLSALVLLAEIAPIEIQRRIVNEAFRGGAAQPIIILVGIYLAITLSEGLLKLVFNLYRSWVGENAVRCLRRAVFAAPGAGATLAAATEGVQIAIVLDEADPIGGFVGESICEPVLQAGVLVGVTGYLLYLQPTMGLVMAGVFLPQIGFVPILQSAINRRIGSRVILYRGLSAGIVEMGRAIDVDGSQGQKIQTIFETNMDIYKLKFSLNFLMNLMTHCGVAAILALGGYFVVTGRAEIGTVVAFLAGLSKVNDPWGELVTWYRDMRAAQVKYAMVRDAVAIGSIDGNGIF